MRHAPDVDAPPRPARVPLTRDDWIEAATDLLADKSIDAVRVDLLARQFGVTRGSFYWHFRDRADLLDSVLAAWRAATQPRLVERFARRTETLEKMVAEMLALPERGRAARRAARIELAIRAWARRDARAREAVDQVDADRVAFIAGCFSAAGFPPEVAQARGFLLYAYDVTQSLLHDHAALGPDPARTAQIGRLLLAPHTPAQV